MHPLPKLAAMLALLAAAVACKGKDDAQPAKAASATPTATPAPTPRSFKTASGIAVVESTPGKPAEKPITVARFKFTLADDSGAEVDAGVIEFTPGEGETLPWLEEAADGMNPGSRRRADIPAGLAADVLQDKTSRTLILELERLE